MALARKSVYWLGSKEALRQPGVTLSLQEGAHLVSMARKTVETAVEENRGPSEDELSSPPEGQEGFLKSRRGVFVTLTSIDGSLRGCIGVPYPVKPLGEAVVHAAVGAATHDPRFPRVTADELDSLTVEVSALTAPEMISCNPVDLPDHVRIGTDGLIVTGLGRSGLLLPQVATELGLTPDDFLSLTCEKAGLLPDAWLTPDVEVKRFQAEVFAEATPHGVVQAHAARP
ncbi:MAG TPA: TIGR00296 family protein [Nitrososphaerales archaeon]|nr:TIGR00296 family protein [Nitrososphaerales archaeon]